MAKKTTKGSVEPLGLLETTKLVAASLAVLVTSTVTSVATAATYLQANSESFNKLVENIRAEGFLTGVATSANQLNDYIINIFTVDKDVVEANKAAITADRESSSALAALETDSKAEVEVEVKETTETEAVEATEKKTLTLEKAEQLITLGFSIEKIKEEYNLSE